MPTTTASPVTLPGTVQQRVAAAAARAGVPVCFQSDPGQGKTATITAWLSAWGYHAEILSPANREPADFLGQMVLTQDGTTGYAPLSWAKRLTQTTRHAAVLLDEANLGAEDTMKALHRVLEEKVVGDLPLPKNTAMICTINPPSNATGAIELPAAVANRMLHLQWDMDFDAWAAGLVGGFDTGDVPTLDSLAPGGSTDDLRREALMVSMFLRQKPELRNACPDTMAQAAGPWPSYRSWTKMVQVLAWLHVSDVDARMAAINGLVGDGAGRSYREFCRTQRLLDPHAALADPSIVDWKNTEPDVLWSLGLAVSALADEDATGKVRTAGLALAAAGAKAGYTDNGWFIARRLLLNMPAGYKVPAQARREFAERFVAAGILAGA